jgi:hypothetical protein
LAAYHIVDHSLLDGLKFLQASGLGLWNEVQASHWLGYPPSTPDIRHREGREAWVSGTINANSTVSSTGT